VGDVHATAILTQHFNRWRNNNFNRSSSSWMHTFQFVIISTPIQLGGMTNVHGLESVWISYFQVKFIVTFWVSLDWRRYPSAHFNIFQWALKRSEGRNGSRATGNTVKYLNPKMQKRA
jgi:hypothetical protein